MQVHNHNNNEDVDILIVGAGLAGLTTSLALHRLGLRSLVLESSESLRITGFALTLWTNAWKALDVVGIGDSLRQKSTQITGFKMALPDTGLFTPGQVLDKDGKFKGYESRCVRRKDLLETLVNELPHDTIRYSSKVTNISELNRFKLVQLADGSILKTKVLIGCDGVNSVVSKWLGLATPVSVGRSAIRGLADFPNGSGFEPLSYLSFGGGTRFGFRPIDDKTVYWFCTFTPSKVPSYEKELQESPRKMKQFVSRLIDKMPREALDVLEKTSLSNISYSTLKIRLPWNVLFGNIAKENVCVAGDALHPMTPDINQGGCSALEDAIVLSRHLGEAFLKKTSGKDDEFDRIGKGLMKYERERRWRSVSLITVAYCVGFIQQSNGKLMSFLRKVWLSNHTSNALLQMAKFDCGDLNFY
uniref:monooxygenase 2-like isoform X2 n=1 Tax=Erigeron canadensis TaxID=72917 RepID=UPI001CB9A5F9|nr:monooxygenase 2-like isoform X2 [Erigeron canadensis]